MPTTLKLFLASSSELVDDRKEFEIFINRKNKEWVNKGVFLELVLWEDFLDALSQTRLQDEYNEAIKGCDVFVMLFFTKVGQYTAEEFETAFGQFKATNRPFIFTYFKDAPINTGDIDEDDMMSLLAFKKKLKALGHFVTPYKNIDDLKYQFNQQLDKLVANSFIEFKPDEVGTAVPGGNLIDTGGGAYVNGNVNTDGSDFVGRDKIVAGTQIVNNYYAATNTQLAKEAIAQQVTGYLRWVQARNKYIELRGIERAGGAPVVWLPLETAYVPLHAKSGWGGTDIPLNKVLGLGNRLVITGGPGSGKTTVLMHMAWALASSLLSGQPDPARSRLGPLMKPVQLDEQGKPKKPEECKPNELPLPIFVPLASFARYRRNLAGNAPANERTLAFFISHHLISKQADFNLPTDFFVQLLNNGTDVLLLLDGLDEVANEDERAEVRQSVEDLVSGREDMRVVVTCRTVAYRSGRTALGSNFNEINVQPLDFDGHITPMVSQAYDCIYPHDAALRTDRVNDLLVGIQRLEQERRARLGERSGALVDSPLMVRLLLIVHFNNRRLPDERADLFDKAINALLQVDYGREEGDISELSRDWKLYRDMAQHLAFHMHQQGRDQGREIGEQELKKALGEEAEFKPRLDGFLSHARQRGSVLEERSGAYRFIHLAFQEFLVARYLREVTGGKSMDAILTFLGPALDNPWWREPILLLVGYMAINATRTARDFLSALARSGSRPEEQFAAAELAGVAALEWRNGGELVRTDCAWGIVELLNDPKALAGSRPVVRARTGDVLLRLGDPRFDPQRFHLPSDELLGFVHIPADLEFMIGTRKADAQRVVNVTSYQVSLNEINDTVTPTPEFYIARYPVTVAQFRAFVEATQFKIGDAKALRDPDNRPVRHVSWYEALAYCNWLYDQITLSPELETNEFARLVRARGWRVTLPSELEWEKAARGGLRNKVFPWGNEDDPNRANYNETKIKDTSAVGCFPANGFGLYDMVGNIWEWTRSRFWPYPYRAEDGRENLKAKAVGRVLRGGSWGYERVHARCACRGDRRPGHRDGNSGFRVVIHSSPVR